MTTLHYANIGNKFCKCLQLRPVLIARVPSIYFRKNNLLYKDDIQWREIHFSKMPQLSILSPPPSPGEPGKRGIGKWRQPRQAVKFFRPNPPTLWVKNIILSYYNFSIEKYTVLTTGYRFMTDTDSTVVFFTGYFFQSINHSDCWSTEINL